MTTHYTERQHSTFLILEKLFEIVIKNYGNNYPYICITTILRNQETVQLLTRIQNIQNISHNCLLMTFHSLDSSQNSGLLHLHASLEQTCKLFLCLGTKCVFLDTFYFILVIGIEPIKNIRGSRLERIYLSSCSTTDCSNRNGIQNI